jgi:hypothetical protein
MRSFRRFFNPWKVLIAAVAICASAAPARADLNLTITDSNGTTELSKAVSNGSTGTVQFSGFDITYTVIDKSTATGTKSAPTITSDLGVTFTVTTAATPSGTATTSDSFKWNLSGTDLKAPAGSTGSATIESLLNVASDSFGNTNKADTLKLNNLRGKFTSDGNSTTSNSVNWTNTQGPGNYNANTSSVTMGSTYKLSDQGAFVYKVKGGTGTKSSSSITFTSTTRVVAAVPEPSGLLAAAAGLPCLGMLVGFVRLRRSRAAAVPA